MKIQVVLQHSKETPGTHRYDTKADDAPVTSVYIQKAAFNGEPPPKSVTVTIVAQELIA